MLALCTISCFDRNQVIYITLTLSTLCYTDDAHTSHAGLILPCVSYVFTYGSVDACFFPIETRLRLK